MTCSRKDSLLIPAMIALLSISACQAGMAQDQRPEATFFAEQSVQMNLYLIVDLANQGRLCDQPSQTVILKKPSEHSNPQTYFLRGSFYVSSGDKKSMEYGRYFLADVVCEKVKRTIAAFRRKGTGEKAVGSVAGNGDLFSVSGNQYAHIGESRFKKVSAPDGEQRTIRVTRFINPATPWTAVLGDKIFLVKNDGKLVQKGWVAWRSIVAADGEKLVILMTKGMGKKARWAGRYNDILYLDGTGN
jgi:hypothetical protein